MMFINTMILALLSMSPVNSSRYQILHNGKMYESTSIQYNDVGCIFFTDEINYPAQQYTFCNNFLVMILCN